MLKSLAKVYGKSKAKRVTLNHDGAKVTFAGEHTSNIEKGLTASFSLQLPFFYAESFPPFSISVNLDYLIDALAIPKGKDATLADLEYRGENSPLVILPRFEGIEHGTIGAVIMPLMPKD